LALPPDGNRHELVRGELRVMPPLKGEHGFVEAAIIAAIDRYLHARALALGWTPDAGIGARDALVGRVGAGEVGLQFAVPDDPHMIRGADGAFLPPEQLASLDWDPHEYFPGVPALVIEVVSASDRASAVAEKVQDYLAGGARRVWVVYPEHHVVHVHDADRPTRVVRGRDSLTDDELLPGFTLPLGLIFARLESCQDGNDRG
jgi:Uma2 family endonuclease